MFISVYILCVCVFQLTYSQNGGFISLLYPDTLKSAGYYVIPSIQKIALECPSVRPSVCPSVRPSVSASFSLSTGSIF